jgi:hypothetical protein
MTTMLSTLSKRRSRSIGESGTNCGRRSRTSLRRGNKRMTVWSRLPASGRNCVAGSYIHWHFSDSPQNGSRSNNRPRPWQNQQKVERENKRLVDLGAILPSVISCKGNTFGEVYFCRSHTMALQTRRYTIMEPMQKEEMRFFRSNKESVRSIPQSSPMVRDGVCGTPLIYIGRDERGEEGVLGECRRVYVILR